MSNRKHIEIVAATERDPIKAAALLIFTKATRLAMDGAGLQTIVDRCTAEPEWMMSELDYMSKTIRSSWEFLDVIFSIRDVSRACAQQITRTRFTPIDGDLYGSYAMQSQRVTDMSAAGWHNPMRGLNETQADYFDEVAKNVMLDYRILTSPQSEGGLGAKLEDARGMLPINLHCNLIAKYNLRILVDLVQARSSYRAQGEFNIIAAEMRSALVEMWPWASLFLRPKDEVAKSAVEDLKTVIKSDPKLENIPAEIRHHMMILLAKIDDSIQGGK